MSGEGFYVYVLMRDDMTPFYVGKGRGDRWLSHERHRQTRGHKSNVINLVRRRLGAIPKFKFAEGLTEDRAFDIERKLIAKFGRYPNGPLTNRTAGGDGMVDPCGDIRAKIAATLKGRKNGPPSAETRRKIGEANRGQKRGPQAPENNNE